MTDGKYSYCKIFTKDAGSAAPRSVVEAAVGGEFDELDSLLVTGVDVEIRRNSDAEGPAAESWRRSHSRDFAGHGDDFLLWPTLIELSAVDGFDDGTKMVEVATLILRSLWNSGNLAIAACDFEDELPEAGDNEHPLAT